MAYQAGVDPALAGAIQIASGIAVLVVLVTGARRATAEAGYLVAVVASQLLSPVLWNHYAMLLLLPVAYLLSAGRWWALADPAGDVDSRSSSITPLDRLSDLLLGHAGRRPAGGDPRADQRDAGVTRAPGRPTRVGLLVVALSFIAYWLADRTFDAGRGDFFYLADAFLHGRSWLDFIPGPYDVIVVGDRYFVPFAPFPAVALMPLVALIGPQSADVWEPGINAALAAASVGLCWWLVGRLGVRRLVDRGWLILLFGFSTQILWVTTRGGVWHTGHLIATVLTLACLIELWGRQRALLIGLLAGAAFLTRAPVAFAIPFYALLLLPWLDRGDAPAAHDPVARVGAAGRRRAPIDRRVLRLQRRPVRRPARIRLRARHPAAVPVRAA